MLGIKQLFVVAMACGIASHASGSVIHGTAVSANQDNSFFAFSVQQSYNGTIAIAGGNGGDMEVSITDTGGNPFSFYEGSPIRNDGVVNSGWGLATTANNGRADGVTNAEALWSGNPYPLPKAYGTTAFRPRNLTSAQKPAIIMDIAATGAPGNSDEWNANATIAVFPRNEFIGGFYDDTTTSGSTPADPNVSPGTLDAFPGITLGTENIAGNFIDRADHGGATPLEGGYEFNMSGLGTDTGLTDATQQGLLLASSAKNENNFVSTRVVGVDTFEIVNKDNADPTSKPEEDDFYFVYLPLGHADTAAMGRIDNEGDTIIGSGSYSITQTQAGEWFLSVPGFDPASSTLILTGAAEDASAVNNIVSFEPATLASIDGWLIQMRDIDNDPVLDPTLGLTGVAADTAAFNFAVFVPEPSSAALAGMGLLLATARRRK